jgi:putative endopeptidase
MLWTIRNAHLLEMFGIEWAKLMRRFFCIGAITALLAGGLALGPSRAQEGCLHITSRVARLLPLDMATGIGASTVAPKYYGAWGIDLSGRDLSVQPGDNFYRYANGAWDDRTEIPPDRTSFSNFAVLAMLGNST